MKRLILSLLFIVLLASCLEGRKKENVIDENYAIENIKIGMSKKQVFDKIGCPADSVIYRNHEGIFIKIYSYNTNNFFDYSLRITVDSTETVSGVSFD
ncbi:MAG: hypothetical protein AAF600_16070 [Bacteroidota bacterium]